MSLDVQVVTSPLSTRRSGSRQPSAAAGNPCCVTEFARIPRQQPCPQAHLYILCIHYITICPKQVGYFFLTSIAPSRCRRTSCAPKNKFKRCKRPVRRTYEQTVGSNILLSNDDRRRRGVACKLKNSPDVSNSHSNTGTPEDYVSTNDTRATRFATMQTARSSQKGWENVGGKSLGR